MGLNRVSGRLSLFGLRMLLVLGGSLLEVRVSAVCPEWEMFLYADLE